VKINGIMLDARYLGIRRGVGDSIFVFTRHQQDVVPIEVFPTWKAAHQFVRKLLYSGYRSFRMERGGALFPMWGKATSTREIALPEPRLPRRPFEEHLG
jgi:hypothetical protein